MEAGAALLPPVGVVFEFVHGSFLVRLEHDGVGEFGDKKLK
jgi:hypothetical protein